MNIINRLNIIYEDVEEIQSDLFFVTKNGLKGVVGPKGLIVPVKYHHLKLVEQFIVGFVSAGVGHIAVYDLSGLRLVPEAEEKQTAVELKAMQLWEGHGIFLLIKPAPFAKDTTLAILEKSIGLKKFNPIERLPLTVTSKKRHFIALLNPGAKFPAPDFTMSLADCITAYSQGTIAAVLNTRLEAVTLEELSYEC